MWKTRVTYLSCVVVVVLAACHPVTPKPMPSAQDTRQASQTHFPISASPTIKMHLSVEPSQAATSAAPINTEAATTLLQTPGSTLTSISGVPIGNCPVVSVPSSVSNAVDMPGKIYMWNSLAPFAHLYLFYEPLWGSANPHPLHPVDPETPGPSQAFSFAFSNYSEQSAYLVRNEQTGLIELWMADLDLCQIQRLWVDAATWFGDYSTLGETAVLKVRWGPGDKSILITQPDSDHVLIHSLSSGQDMLWSGACDRIVRSPISGRLALGCLPGEAGGEDGLVVETDGSLQSEAIQQDLLMQVLDWSFSPDSSRVSFANAEPYEVNKLKVNFYKTGIMEQDGSFLELPITWTDWRMDDDFYDFYNYKRTMQWARDGSKLLVVGLDRMLDVDACPQDGRPCWFMLDAHSGAIQWYLTHKETEFSAEEWEEVEFLYEAALSPDGKWVAMFFDWRAPFKYFVAISLDTNQAIDLGGYNGLSLYWAK